MSEINYNACNPNCPGRYNGCRICYIREEIWCSCFLPEPCIGVVTEAITQWCTKCRHMTRTTKAQNAFKAITRDSNRKI